MNVSCTILGLEGVEQKLQQLATDKATEMVRDALRAGADVIEAEVAERTPVRTGDLLDNLTRVELESSQLGAGAIAIGFGQQGYVARFVEFGHNTPHGTHVPAHPFMRQAMDSCSDAAVEAFTQSINDSLAKG